MLQSALGLRLARARSLLSRLVFLSALCALGAEPAGLKPGERPGPYAFVISTGPNRGKAHCYICETGDRPAVIVFARSLSEPLAKLVQQLDKALVENQKAELKGWVTFLNPNQTAFDPQLVQWSLKHALRQLPLGVFEDADGPPSYRLSRAADVTVLLFVKQKVVANFAFHTGDLNDAKVAEVLQTLPRILPAR